MKREGGMNPGHCAKYILPSEKSQTRRDKICDPKILRDLPGGDSRPRLESVDPAVDPRLYQQPGQDSATARARYYQQTIKRSSIIPGFPLGTCLLHLKASPQL